MTRIKKISYFDETQPHNFSSTSNTFVGDGSNLVNIGPSAIDETAAYNWTNTSNTYVGDNATISTSNLATVNVNALNGTTCTITTANIATNNVNQLNSTTSAISTLTVNSLAGTTATLTTANIATANANALNGTTAIFSTCTSDIYNASSNVGINFQNLQDAWAFKYANGLGVDDTGFFINLTASQFEIRVANVPLWSLDSNGIVGSSARTYIGSVDQSTGYLDWNSANSRIRCNSNLEMNQTTGLGIIFRGDGEIDGILGKSPRLTGVSPLVVPTGELLWIGDGTTGKDFGIHFDGENNDGIFRWKETLDYFEFEDDVLIAGGEALYLRDTGVSLDTPSTGRGRFIASNRIILQTPIVYIGSGVAGVDYQMIWNGQTHDGIITWMEDEDYFQFSDDILLPDNERIFFGGGKDVEQYYDGTYFHINTGTTTASDMLITCGTEKTIELQNTVWEDLRIPGLSVEKGSSAPDLDPFLGAGNLLVNRFDGGVTTEQVYFTCQLPHSWKEGTDLVPHIHWAATSSTVGNVKWQLEYSFASQDITFPASTIITATDTTSGTAWDHQLTNFPNITTTNSSISSMLVCRLFRDPTDSADTYNADAAFLEFDLHIELNTIGSRQTLIK